MILCDTNIFIHAFNQHQAITKQLNIIKGNIMQTVLNVQDNLWQQALKLANTDNNEEFITLVLSEFIQSRSTDYINKTKQALAEAQKDLAEGNYSKNDIDAHISEIFDS